MSRRVALISMLMLVAGACGGGSEPSVTTAAAATTNEAPATTTAAPATTTTAAPATTTAAPATTTAAPATTTAAPTTTTVPPTTTTTFVPTHGGDAVGVYLGVVLQEDATTGIPPEFQNAIDIAEGMGFFAGYSDMACDQGAREGLGLADGYYNAVSVLFADLDSANSFADAYPGDVVGVVAVKTYCLD